MNRPIASRSCVLACVLAGLLGLAACAVGPDFATPAAPASDHFTAAGETMPAQAALGSKVSGEWWRLYGSSDLDAVIGLALKNNQTLEAAKATLTQVRQKAEATSGILYPQVDLHSSAAREKVNFTSYGMNFPQFPPHTLNVFSVGGTVSYSLDLFGHDRRQAEAADAQAQAQGFRLDGAYLTLTGQVVMQAIDAAALEEQVRLQTAIIADDRKRADLMRLSRQAGTVSDLDVADAEAQLAADSAMLPALRAQLAATRHTMAVLVGQTPDQWSPPVFDLSSFRVPKDIPVSLPSELVRQRPDIQAAEADLHEASAMIGVAEANRYPRLTLSADVSQWATLPGHLWDSAATGASIGGGLTAPLFHGGQLAAEQRAAESAYQASFARYRQTVLESFAQVATVLQSLTEDEEATRQSGKAVAATGKATRFATLQQQSRTIGLLPLLVAQRQDNMVRMSDIRVRAQYLKDSAELFLSMGGGWWDWEGAANRPPPQLGQKTPEQKTTTQNQP